MGEGLVLHVISKIIFVLTGYAMNMYLGKVLTPAEYGVIGVILSIMNIDYNFLSNGIRQAASSQIAAGRYERRDLIRKSVIYQFLVAVALSLVSIVGADAIASVLNVPDLANDIRITAVTIPFTAMYFISVGIINGFRLFRAETMTMIAYCLMKLTVIPYVGSVFSESAYGTLAAYLSAAVVGSVLGLLRVRKIYGKIPENEKKEKPRISSRDFVRCGLDFLIFFICITVILNLDMLFTNALVTDMDQVGYYTAATNFAKVAYYLLSALYLVSLPVLTAQYSRKDEEGCSSTIQELLMVVLAFVLPIVMIIVPTMSNLLAGFYKAAYRAAGMATGILMFGQFFIGMFVIFYIFLCAAGRKTYGMVLALVVTGADALACRLMIPAMGINGAALATLTAGFLGCVLSWKKLTAIYRNMLTKRHLRLFLMDLVLAAAMALLAHYWITENIIQVAAVYAAVYLGYLLLLNGLKVISVSEIVKKIRHN